MPTVAALKTARVLAFVSACSLASSPSRAQPVQVSGPDQHADWPSAMFAPNGDLWVAWASYDGRGSDEIRVRQRSGGEWQTPMVASARAGDHLKTALAVQPDGRIWVAWSAQVAGNFDLYARSWRDGRWEPVRRLTTDPQPDIHHRLLAGPAGRLYLVWQSFRTGDANIYLKVHDGNRWSAVIPVTSHEANDWEPDAALDAQGRLFIVYDTYRHGDYDVYLRVFESGELSPERAVADSPRFEARATVAVVPKDARGWHGTTRARTGRSTCRAGPATAGRPTGGAPLLGASRAPSGGW